MIQLLSRVPIFGDAIRAAIAASRAERTSTLKGSWSAVTTESLNRRTWGPCRSTCQPQRIHSRQMIPRDRGLEQRLHIRI